MLAIAKYTLKVQQIPRTLNKLSKCWAATTNQSQTRCGNGRYVILKLNQNSAPHHSLTVDSTAMNDL